VRDAIVLGMIRDVIRATPFAGEGGHRVTARLRWEQDIGVSRKRVALGFKSPVRFQTDRDQGDRAKSVS
jgi:hypothetical protein